MRYLLLGVLLLAFGGAFSQKKCPRNSILYRFEKNAKPRYFTERLGNHPEFPFLQRENGVTSVATFLASINDTARQNKWEREFKAFDLLLRNSGFTRGYRDLNASSIEKVYVQRGTLGNLGFYDRVNDLIHYIYVILSPAGEESLGTAAWKLTNRNGCYFYILHTCGNAFYPQNDFESDCCKTVTVESAVTPLELKNDSANTQIQVGIKFYQGKLVPVSKRKSKSGYDTVVHLARRMDTTVTVKTGDLKRYRIYANDQMDRILVCADSVVRLTKRLLVDSATLVSNGGPILINLADTSYISDSLVSSRCNNKWEIFIDGGMSLNSTPNPIRATDHTKSNGMALAGQFSIGRIINPWFSMGLSASYIILSYQDDVPYPGSVAGTYNTVYLGKPMIPVQAYAKFSIGREVGWQSIIVASAGYAIPTNARIENSGTVLTTDPGVVGGLTAGLKLGINYFPTCHFGLGLSFTGQFFSNTSTVTYSNFFALPILAGLRFRF